MGALSSAHLTRAGIEHIQVLNRSLSRAQRLVRKIRESGVRAEALILDRLADALADADVVVSCTGRGEPGGLAGRCAPRAGRRAAATKRPTRW